MRCRMVSSILASVHQMPVLAPPPVVITKNVSRYCQSPLRGKLTPLGPLRAMGREKVLGGGRRSGRTEAIHNSELGVYWYFSRATGMLWAGDPYSHFTGERFMERWMTCPKMPRRARSAWP